MKKFVFALLTFTVCYGAESSAFLTAKILPTESHGYFILTDGTFWKVATFVKRWRSPLEWLGGAELQVPENYISSLNDWTFNDVLEVYPKYGNVTADESAASNQEELKKCSHLIVNPRTEKILFAIPLHAADFATQLYNDGYSKGHSDGYGAGYNAGYSLGKFAAKNSDD